MDPQQPASRNNQFFNNKDDSIVPDNTDHTQTSSTLTDDPTNIRRHHVEVHPGATDIASSHQAILSDTDKPLPADPSSAQNSSIGGDFQHGKNTTSAAYNPQLKDHSTNTPSNTPQSQSGLVDSSNIDPLSSTTDRNLSTTATHGSADTTDSTRFPTDTNTTNPDPTTYSDGSKIGGHTTNPDPATYSDGSKIGGHNTDPTVTTTTTTTTTTTDHPSATKGLKDTVAGTVQKIAGAISGNPERRAAGEARVRDGKEQLAAANEQKKGNKVTEGYGRGDLEGTHVNDEFNTNTNTNTVGGDYNTGVDAGRHQYGRGDVGGAEVGTDPAFATANTTPADYVTTGNFTTGSKGHGRGDLEGVDAKEI